MVRSGPSTLTIVQQIPASRLELLADECGFEPDELRDALHRMIRQRLSPEATSGTRVVLRCQACGDQFELSERREREIRGGRSAPVCRLCRAGTERMREPGPKERHWIAQLDPDVRERALALMSMLAA